MKILFSKVKNKKMKVELKYEISFKYLIIIWKYMPSKNEEKIISIFVEQIWKE